MLSGENSYILTFLMENKSIISDRVSRPPYSFHTCPPFVLSVKLVSVSNLSLCILLFDLFFTIYAKSLSPASEDIDMIQCSIER